MNKSELKAIFINAKATDAKYIGVSIQTEGSSQPEIIINPNPNFDAKFDYYMEAYDDDLILIAAKGKKDIRITAAGQGNRFEDIECQLLGERGKDRTCDNRRGKCIRQGEHVDVSGIKDRRNSTHILQHKGESDYQIHAYVDLGGENIADF